MKCADARRSILTADPARLRDRTDPVLRAHLNGCAECAAAANLVLADLNRLRAALIARGAPVVARRMQTARRRALMTAVPVALAAELAFFAFLGNREAPVSLGERVSAIDDTVMTLLPSVSQSRIDTGDVIVAPAPRRAEVVKPAAPSTDTTTEAKDTVSAPVPSEFTPVAQMKQLQVTPTTRQQRVAVIGTANPRITVVWLSKDSL